MGLYNFMQASASQDKVQANLDAVQADMLKLLTEGKGAGVSKFAAHADWRYKAAAQIREAVTDTFAVTDPTPMFCERRTLANGDRYEFERLVSNMKVVQYSPGAAPQVFTPRKAKYTIGTSRYEMNWGIELMKVINRQFQVSDFARMAADAMSRFMQELVFGAINVANAANVVDLKGRAVRSTVAGGAITKTALDAAIRRMYSGGLSGLTIAGTRWALDPIFEFVGGLSENLKDELANRGVIGNYRGARIVEITDDHQLYSNTFAQIPGAGGTTVGLDQLVFITSSQPGAVLLERDLSQLDFEELDVVSAQWRQRAVMDLGVFVHTPANQHVIQINA